MRIRIRSILPRILSVLLALGGGGGCEQRPAPDASDMAAPRTADDDTQPRSDWRRVDDSPQVALEADADDEALAAAIARARATAERARLRWRATPTDEREGWAIRWAAPTADDGLEYLWVEPIHWSRHRVEGRLANPPQRELACGKHLDDLVSFPIEQLADWIAPPGEGISEPGDAERAAGETRTGGFTVRLMEKRYGRTQPTDDGE
ncbi:MAG: DUF2314 domain-containing protein [Planctomycetota bacterium]|nr:DUF2314 domain-containing protein [Planctomycetota bacterium]